MKQMLLYNDVNYKPKLNRPYSKGPYNKILEDKQIIRITEGCPNFCEFCAESFENGSKPVYYDFPKILKNYVQIIDMNLIYKPNVLGIIEYLGKQKPNNKKVKYELVCGVDYRFLNLKIAKALKDNNFINIRIAWDHSIKEQIKIYEAIKNLKKAGYNQKDIMVFMICNHKQSYEDNLFKMDLCKIWGVKICACWFDNQVKNIKPITWTYKQIEDFNRRERKHNQLINFKIDPELKLC